MQLQFDFTNPHSYQAVDYIVSDSNWQAYETIKSWPNWGDGIYSKILYLWGEKATGKTHLSRIWAEISGAKSLQLEEISIDELNNHQAFIIEDLERYQHREEEILHIFNMMLEMDKYLLITSSVPPNDLKIQLPDLKSRLNAINLVKINAADDQLLETLLIKLFSERALKIDINVISYIITHSDRSLDYLNHLIGQIDKYSIASKKPPSIKMIKRLLDLG